MTRPFRITTSYGPADTGAADFALQPTAMVAAMAAPMKGAATRKQLMRLGTNELELESMAEPRVTA
jgi:hypothetical protein